jgi:hypothetical protein
MIFSKLKPLLSQRIIGDVQGGCYITALLTFFCFRAAQTDVGTPGVSYAAFQVAMEQIQRYVPILCNAGCHTFRSDHFIC